MTNIIYVCASLFLRINLTNRNYCVWCLYWVILSILDRFQTYKQVKFQFAT